MPAPKGNKNSLGKGRKSKYQEIADANRLWNLWTDKDLPKTLQEKLRDKKGLSAEEMHLLRGYLKSDANLNAIFSKLYPTGIDLTTGGEKLGVVILPSREKREKNGLETAIKTRNRSLPKRR